MFGCTRRNVRKMRGTGHTLYVDSAATGDADGSSWANAFPSLATCLEGTAPGASDGWEILVAGAPTSGKIYYPDTSDPGNRSLYMTPWAGVPIYGGFVGGETRRASRNPSVNLTIVSGDIGEGEADRSYHGFGWMEKTAAVVDGFTITKFRADGEVVNGGGGGFFTIIGAGQTFRNCRFTDCVGLVGGAGGAAFGIGTIYFRAVTIDNCAAADGGGFYGQGFKLDTDDACVIDTCTANDGAGIHAEAVFVRGGTIKNCTATGNGGAIFCADTENSEITGVLFDACTANSGAAIYNNSAYDNSAYDPAITNCTVVNCVVGESGYIIPIGHLKNCIMWDNTGTNMQGGDYNTATYSDIEISGETPVPGVGNILADPLFVGSGSYRLQAGSPCKGTGDDGRDMGCYPDG